MVRLIGKKEVAEMLGCSVRQVDNLREKKGLPWLYLGTSVRFRPDAVSDWILKQEQAGNAKNAGSI